ncbi:MAG: hypothetical protein KUG56_01525 [Kordiimonadaceae bacterium]|nr:hypothetical protein [Kordiimonadaceae bacterium]
MVLRGKTRTRFSVQAHYDVNTLSRVLELFTIRGLACDNLHATRTSDGLYWIELDCSDIEDMNAGLIMNKIRQIITVQSVRIETTMLAVAA